MTKFPLRSILAPERVGDRISIEIVGTYGSATVSAIKGKIVCISQQDYGSVQLNLSEARSLSLALEAAIAFAEGK